MEKILKIGVFGLWRGMSFAEIIHDSFKDKAVVYAVCDKRADRVKEALEQLPECKLSFDNFDEFIDCGLDGVILTNYFHEHAAYAIKAMKKGIAVFSETTPAVTFTECAELCDTVEQYNGKYYFSENYPFSAANLEMKRLYETGTLGNVGYAEGEYWHPSSNEDISSLDPEPYHWRKYANAGAFYCSHALAPLMYITGARPVSVNAMTYTEKGRGEAILRFSDEYVTPMLLKMDSGAVFRVMGASLLSPHGNWYRLGCTKGGVETIRGDESKIRLKYNSWDIPEGAEEEKVYAPDWSSNSELAEKAGHGGGDFWVIYYFLGFINGENEAPFDVYRAVDIACVGIQAWRSVLNNSNTYPIPDFRDMRQRDAYRYDNLTIFGDENGKGATLPCSSTKLPDEFFENYENIMKEKFGKKAENAD